MRRNQLVTLLIVVVLIAAIVGIVLLLRRSQSPQAGNTDNSGAALSGSVGKPPPIARTFMGCPPSGDGGDPVLNTLKDRIDEGQWTPSTVASILALTWPKAIERQPRSKWSAADAANIAQYEGTPVQVEGYLLDAKKMSPESCNCHSVTYVDFHIWMADDPNKKRTEAIVIEVTPRVKSVHPAWTIQKLGQIARGKQKVRISGWLMMDPEHPDQVGKTRGTIWEIHPIMQIETQSGGTWQPLDNGTTGVKSVGVAAQTLPTITAVPPATLPPSGSDKVQNNKSVQITTVFYDGLKKNEPDEYVEIANKGKAPVDITDWEIQDQSGDADYKWESYVLQPGASIRVYTNEVHPESGGFTFDSGRALWANTGDVAELYDSDKQLVSRYAYGNKK